MELLIAAVIVSLCLNVFQKWEVSNYRSLLKEHDSNFAAMLKLNDDLLKDYHRLGAETLRFINDLQEAVQESKEAPRGAICSEPPS